MAIKYRDEYKGTGSQLTEPCFCNDDGRICWTNGEMYVRNGTAPGRIKIFYLVSGEWVRSYGWVDRLNLATPAEVERFCDRVAEQLKRKKEKVEDVYIRETRLIESNMRMWEERGKAVLCKIT